MNNCFNCPAPAWVTVAPSSHGWRPEGPICYGHYQKLLEAQRAQDPDLNPMPEGPF